jgi:hypothetical protein
MKITKARYYDGAKDKVCRLGLADLFLEVPQIVLDTQVDLLEESQANGAAVVREALDEQFARRDDWELTKSGGVDWVKRLRYNQTFLARLGVEVQVSARSDLLIRDIVHLRNSIQCGEIEVGIIIVPDDRMQGFLTDRTPSYRDAIRYIETEFKEAMNFPIVVLAVEHDGPGPPLPKKVTNTGKKLAKQKSSRKRIGENG